MHSRVNSPLEVACRVAACSSLKTHDTHSTHHTQEYAIEFLQRTSGNSFEKEKKNMATRKLKLLWPGSASWCGIVDASMRHNVSRSLRTQKLFQRLVYRDKLWSIIILIFNLQNVFFPRFSENVKLRTERQKSLKLCLIWSQRLVRVHFATWIYEMKENDIQQNCIHV